MICRQQFFVELVLMAPKNVHSFKCIRVSNLKFMPLIKIYFINTFRVPFGYIWGHLKTAKSQAIIGNEGGNFGYCQMLFANVEHKILEITEAIKISRVKEKGPLPLLTLGKNALTVIAYGLFVAV